LTYGIACKLENCLDTQCGMCRKYGVREWYLWLGWQNSTQLKVCRKCALREIGTKYKKNFDKIIKRRTKEWHGKS